jgi:hypothetical protein
VIALVMSMLRARRGQAFTVWLLSALATASAVAAPAYLAAVDRAIVTSELANAPGPERSLRISATVEQRFDGAMSREFEDLAAARLDAPGFVTVFSAAFAAIPGDVPSADADAVRRFTFREDVCAHVVVAAGRCLMGAAEVVVGDRAAARAGLAPGDRLSSRSATFDPLRNAFVPAGAPFTVTVVGLVRPRDATEPYWGLEPTADAFYVSRYTLAGADHDSELQTFEAYAGPDAISVDRLPALREWLDDAVSTGDARSATTALPDLLDRIDRSRRQAHQTVPLAAIPLVLLAWAVIVFAVATAARAQRFERGVVALRGVATPARWWLASGETVLAVVAGAPLGFLAGFAAVAAAAPARPVVEPAAFAYAGAAVVGALLAGLAIQFRAVTAPAIQLLREVDARAGRWRSWVADVLVLLLAGAAVVQARSSAGGVALLAPALVIAAVGVLGARVLPPLATRFAALSLRRGRLAAALTAFRLARQPAGHRLLVVLVVAAGLLGFALTATTVTGRAQARQAELTVGAATVLPVGPVTRRQLLQAVRAADPDGRYAMAAVPFGDRALAVDSARLPAVALWHANDARDSLASLAGRLHPAVPTAPLQLTGARLAVDLTVDNLADTTPAVGVVVAPADGRPTATIALGALVPGRRTYEAASSACVAGCRLVSVEVTLPTYLGRTIRLTLHRLQGRPVTGGWRVAPGAEARETPDGLALALPTSPRRDAGRIQPSDTPLPLPVVSAGSAPADASFDERPVTVAVAGSAVRLPRLGTAGTLVDLEYLDRLATDAGVVTGAEVWLSSGAPPAVVDRLTAQGIAVLGRRTVAGELAALRNQGPALGIRFFVLAGVLAVVLGAAGFTAAAVSAPAADLEALRRHGLSRTLARRVAALTPASVLVLALPLGALAAAAAWFAVA